MFINTDFKANRNLMSQGKQRLKIEKSNSKVLHKINSYSTTSP